MEVLENSDRRSQVAKILGTNILKLRKQKGYTREELAEKSNLSSNYIYGLETGTYLPGCLALIDLSNALDTTSNQLLDCFIDNKKTAFLEEVSKNVDKLSDRDLSLILNIIDFCINNHY